MSRNSRTGFRRLLRTLRFCAASFMAAGFFGTAFAATHDFNGDHKSDILWFRSVGGQVAIWFMNGTSATGGGSPGSVPSVSNWQIVGQRDFNRDGNSDILWRDGVTGQVAIWFLNGSTAIGGGSPGSANNMWAIVGTGDFNGDGYGDILWYNHTLAQTVIWLMNGTTVLPTSGSIGSPPSEWSVVGTGDFNGDGFADIVWWSINTGQAVIWFMNGTSVIGGGSPGSAPLEFRIV